MPDTTMCSLSTKTRTLNRMRAVLRGRAPVERLLAARPRRWAALDGAVLKLAPNHYQYDDGEVRLVERDGVRFEVRLHEYHGWCLFYGAPDRSRDALLRLVGPGDHCIDVGANVGEFSLRLAQRVGEEGRVLAVEPFPDTRGRLLRNLDLNPVLRGRIATDHRALAASEAGAVAMSAGRPDNAGTAHVTAAAPGDAAIPTTTLDRVVHDAGLERVDVVKIDVEGYELHVLRGAEQTVAAHRPVLFVEVDEQHLTRAGSSAAELLAWFDAHDYAMADAYTGQAVDASAPWPGRHTDLIARARHS